MTYIKIGTTEYPAKVTGRMEDRDWDGRHTKEITLEMTYAQAAALFTDGVGWSVVVRDTISVPQTGEDGTLLLEEDGSPVIEEQENVEEYDNSDFTMAGPITDNRDGTVRVKMGAHTQQELALSLLESQLAEADELAIALYEAQREEA